MFRNIFVCSTARLKSKKGNAVLRSLAFDHSSDPHAWTYISTHRWTSGLSTAQKSNCYHFREPQLAVFDCKGSSRYSKRCWCCFWKNIEMKYTLYDYNTWRLPKHIHGFPGVHEKRHWAVGSSKINLGACKLLLGSHWVRSLVGECILFSLPCAMSHCPAQLLHALPVSPSFPTIFCSKGLRSFCNMVSN